MDSALEGKLEMALANLNRVSLGEMNTPLEHLPRFSAALGGPQVWIKRDDLTGLAFGGNKTRMLEYSLAVGVERGADTIVYGAAVQSNYCRQLAAACAKLGITLHLILRSEREIDKTVITGNNLLQRLLGAHVTVLSDNDRDRQQEAIAAKAEELRAAGHNVYVPRQADTVDLDVIAYAQSALEVARQCRQQEIDPRHMYVCAADTTQAGLVLGLKAVGSPMQVKGINPSFKGDNEERMAQIANQAAERLDLDVTLTAADFDNDDSFVGDRYGIPTPDGLAALHLLARKEGHPHRPGLLQQGAGRTGGPHPRRRAGGAGAGRLRSHRRRPRPLRLHRRNGGLIGVMQHRKAHAARRSGVGNRRPHAQPPLPDHGGQRGRGDERVIAELLRGKVHIERHLGWTAGDSTEFRHCASVTQTFPRGR